MLLGINESPLPKLPPPAELGFRMPAEWERQAGIWLAWPSNPETWPGELVQIQNTLATIAATITRFEPVFLLCPTREQDKAKVLLHQAQAHRDHLHFYDMATDDVWCRDYGPTFLKNDHSDEVAFVDWNYNAWGEKYPYGHDKKIPEQIAATLLMKRFKSDLTCEGGALEINTQGLLLTTESVILNSNRNPDWNKEETAKHFATHLGVKDICWLPQGIHHDDTDGHIDMLARFFKDDGIVAILEKDSHHEDYAALALNREILESLRTPTGGRYDMAYIPQPDPIYIDGWRTQRLPASYANFLILNDAVLVPTYRQKKADTYALGLINELFPKREVIGIDCLDIIKEGGALHCLSQQQPA